MTMSGTFQRAAAVAAAVLFTHTSIAGEASIKMTSFGKLADGREAKLYTLTNAKGLQADITDYGGIVVRVLVPNRDGSKTDVVLGYNTLSEYVKETPYFGCLVGRFGNRIAHGRFVLDGATYTLATNNAPGDIPCALHGGLRGFDKVLWEATPRSKDGVQGLELHYASKDGEEGYPGNLDVTVWYWLTDANELKIEYKATTDKATPVNLTNHSYFNLKGEGNGDILDHVLTFKAGKTTPVNAGLIPTGELRPVAGTPFDFTSPHAIGERVNQADEQLKFGGGYDHNWVLDNQGGALALAATVLEPASGRTLEVWTTEPGLQFYCGNFLDGKLTGKSGKPYNFRNGLCLETQHYPDSPNQPAFPSTILRPGQTYQTATIYRFGSK